MLIRPLCWRGLRRQRRPPSRRPLGVVPLRQLFNVYGVLSSHSHRSRQLRRPLLSPTIDASVPPKNVLRTKDAVEQTHLPVESSDRQGRQRRAQGKGLDW